MLEVWRVDLEQELPHVASHLALLGPDETERARRFHRELDRARFVVGRATRRLLLSGATGIASPALRFATGPFGKPRLLVDTGPGLHFNSSHSGRWILHALSSSPVGVDVEQVRADMAQVQAFASVLSPREQAAVSAHGDPRRRAAALATAWVRKEAYVKALGDGLNRELSGIGIGDGPGTHPVLEHDLASPGREGDWCFTDFETDADHRACVVSVAPRRPVVVRTYPASSTSWLPGT